MISIEQYLKNYYQKNVEVLQNHYPGLPFQRLLNEFCFYANVRADEVFWQFHSDFFFKLETGIPLEYINHCAYFYRSEFYVDERVLIPRSETEILVEDAISFIKQKKLKSMTIAEVGVGSFALGLSIIIDSSIPIHFIGGDISTDALEVARLNLYKLANKIGPKHDIKLVYSDRMSEMNEKFDLIVTNPPYIREVQDRKGVHHQADQFEPHLALYLADDIFDSWYDAFFQDVSLKLNNGGAIFLEGHEDSLLQLQKTAFKYFEKVQIKKDYSGRDRFLHAYK